MAGTAAYFRIDSFIYAPMGAIGLAMTTFVGQNIGAKQYGRIRKAVHTAFILAVSITVFLDVFVLIFHQTLLKFFTDSPEVIRYGVLAMIFLAPFSWIHSFTEVLSGTIRGAGNALVPMIMTAVNICLFRIIWITVLTNFWLDLRIVIASFPVSWVLCALSFIIYYRRNTWLEPI
jgi:Na+-driven multidrug efflux pump